jgi:hypothetical protein
MFAGKFQLTDGCARIWLGLNAKNLASHLRDNGRNWTVQNLSRLHGDVPPSPLVTLLPHSANAETLTITRGRADLSDDVGSLIFFGGPGFSVFQTREPGVFGLIGAFGVEPFELFTGFNSSFLGGMAEVRVGTQVCRGNTFPGGSCGNITFTSPGFAIPIDWPLNTLFVATVPFTATGQLLVGGNQYDMVGHGTVTGTRCLAAASPGGRGGLCGTVSERAHLTYNFSVGEPPSLVLMLVSTIAIGIVFLVHRRSIVNI